ncbi:hypothetical protein AVEN_63497-1 [Araneus ventricosus]|uniref:Uncharacterized protein n=1 Tax=Araneus ventricosus TaxID=182803 RepID=A0A4Y2JND0_ARAVE|nr:hypothetical protein AVEN_63497-1 [Araneus ventricosus]
MGFLCPWPLLQVDTKFCPRFRSAVLLLRSASPFKKRIKDYSPASPKFTFSCASGSFSGRGPSPPGPFVSLLDDTGRSESVLPLTPQRAYYRYIKRLNSYLPIKFRKDQKAAFLLSRSY